MKKPNTCLLTRIVHTEGDLLINTEALARWKEAVRPRELFQQFVNRSGKPLNRLIPLATSLHRAKASVLMRACLIACGMSVLTGLVALPILADEPATAGAVPQTSAAQPAGAGNLDKLKLELQ